MGKHIATIIAQAALLNAEVAGMVALNQYRIAIGAQVAYSEDAFASVIEKYPDLISLAQGSKNKPDG